MSKSSGRYSVPSSEDFEPGSNNEVVKNFLGVKSKEIMAGLEQRELDRAEDRLWQVYDEDHRFTAEDIRDIHEQWLGNLYPMAGKYRTVQLVKDDFAFAAANQIEKLMAELENRYLTKYTPCHFEDSLELAYALGLIHVELILIHPFREGNGRTARLLADLMAMQSARKPLNYSSIRQESSPKGFQQYVSAIHASMNRDYSPIQHIFLAILKQSLED